VIALDEQLVYDISVIFDNCVFVFTGRVLVSATRRESDPRL